eukprot:scaffold41854_cov78-Phaeocystis_antarctica.AAC.3
MHVAANSASPAPNSVSLGATCKSGAALMEAGVGTRRPHELRWQRSQALCLQTSLQYCTILHVGQNTIALETWPHSTQHVVRPSKMSKP